VDDCAEAIVLAAGRYDGAEPVNVGSGDEITIKDLTEKVARLTGFEGAIEWDSSKPDGQPRRKLDTSRARELFGFEATVALDDGLGRTIQWFRGEASTSTRGSGNLAATR
jgi:nucleoside-diphosphate-sugar epimerase